MNPIRALLVLVAAAVIAGAAWLMSTDPATTDPVANRPTTETASSAKPEAPDLASATDDATPFAEAPTPTRAAAEPAVAPEEHVHAAAKTAACKVTGRVVNESGAAIPNVAVSLNTLGGFVIVDEDGGLQRPRKRETKSGSDGRFTLEDVHAGFGLTVRAEPEALVMADKPIPKQDGGVIDLGDFVCATGGTLAGKVVDDAGNPIAGANVQAWTVEKAKNNDPGLLVFGDAGAANSRHTKTDGSGAFRIAGLAPGDAAIIATAEGHTREFKKGVEVKKGEITPELRVALSSGFAIEGIAVDQSGRPVAGAKVRVMETVIDLSQGGLSSELQRSREAESDAAGYFRITGLKESSYNVTGSASDMLPVRASSVAAGSKDLRLQFKRAGMLYGYVRSTTDKSPVGDFKVRVSSDEGFGLAFRAKRSTDIVYGDVAAKAVGVSDPNGLFAIPAVPGEDVTMEIEADGYAAGTQVAVSVPPGGKVQRDVELTPEIRLSGLVLDPDAKLMPGATVRITEHQENRGSRGIRIAKRGGFADETGNFTFDGEMPSATTGEDGRFVMKGLRPGAFDLVASHDNWAPSEKLPVTLGEGDEIDDLELTLEAAGTLAGVTYDADGKMLANALVSLQKKRAAGSELLSMLGGSDEDLPPRMFGDGAPLTGTSAADGKYEIHGIPPGQYMASVKAMQNAQRGGSFFMMEGLGAAQKGKPVTIEAGEESQLDLALAPTGRVHGTVTESGKPLANVPVGLRQKGGFMPMDVVSGKTDDGGAFELEDVEPGEYVLTVKAPGSAQPATREVEIRGRETANVDVPLPSGGISGQVKDKDSGEPLADVLIEVRKHQEGNGDAAPQPTERRAVSIMMVTNDGGGGGMQTMKFGDDEESVRTDAEGNFVIRYLEPGDYDVEIRGAGVSPVTKEHVRVQESKVTAKVDFDAERGAAIVVTAKAADDDPIDFVMVDYNPAGNPGEANSEANSGNTVTLDGLKAGTYDLAVRAGDKKGRASVTVSSGERKPITVDVN